MAQGNMAGQPVSNKTFDPSGSKGSTAKLMNPNAVEDQETVTGDNPQKAWLGSGTKPTPPFGPQGRMF